MKRSQRGMGRPSLGGLLATRQGGVVLALVCAACAAGVMLYAISGYKQGVQKAVAPSQATVLVATGAIQKGTSGNVIASEKLYKSTPVIASQLSPGAISDASVLQGKTAQSDVLPGQQLTSAEFTGTAGATAQLSPNQRALSIATDEVHGDLDVVVPGDRVDIYAELAPSGGSGSTAQSQITLLAPNVLVLKTPGSAVLGASVTTKPTTGVAAGTAIVFQVNSSLVPILALTADTGKIWLSLRPANAANPPAGTTTAGSLSAQAGAASTRGTSGSTTAPTSTTTGTKK